MSKDKVLIVSGHPRIDNDSVANKAILEEYEKRLPNALIDRLDLLYPDYNFDVAAEQAKLEDADIIVLQFPVFWYGMPSLMQKWIEDVIVHGFAYGSTGKALVGKDLIASFTLGAPEEAYREDAPVHLEDIMAPIRGLCALTGMNLAGWEHCADVSYASRTSDEACQAIQKQARNLADRVIHRVETLQDAAE